jgi:ribosomal protein L11 methyltransferase
VAAREAARNAAKNACAARVAVFTGGLDALAGLPFELVLANLLRSEAEPLLASLAMRTRPGGQAVFSGLLAAEAEVFAASLAEAGFRRVAERACDDASGERWVALLTRR